MEINNRGLKTRRLNVLELKSGRFQLLACMMIVFAGFVIYSNTTHSSFHFDDKSNIVKNPLIRDLHNIPQFFQKNGITFPSRGLVTTSFAVNYYFSGLAVESYHWVNISIHLLNGILVYFLAVFLLKNTIINAHKIGYSEDAYHIQLLALFAALLFVSSPVQTQSVTYIFQRNGLMASFFYLLSLMLFIKAVAGSRFNSYLYAGSILSLLCALWCKEMAYSAPVIIFLLYQCFIAESWKSVGKGLRLSLPFLVLAALSFYFSVAQDPPQMENKDWGRWEYLLTQSNVLTGYVKLLLMPLPSRLNVDVDFPLSGTLWELTTLISAVSIVAVLTAAVLFLDRVRLPAFCVLWFFIILAPTSSIIPLRDLMVTHRLYLPGLGFLLLLTVGIHKAFHYLLARKGPEPRRLCTAEIAVLTGIVLFYGVCAYERNKVWETDILLWKDTVKKSPDKLRPHYNLGCAYKEKGLINEAKQEYLRCEALYDSLPNIRNKNELDSVSEACNNLGNIYVQEEQYYKAIKTFTKALKINYHNVEAHNNLGIAYVLTNALRNAEEEFRLALSIEPTYTRAYCGIGAVYEKRGLQEEAISAYTTAVNSEPENAAARIALAQLLFSHKKDSQEAIHHLQEARRVCNDQKTLEMVNKILATLEKQMAVIRPSE